MGLSAIFANFCLCLLSVSAICVAVDPNVGQIRPGFTATQAEWAEQNGQFLRSNNSAFTFGFYRAVEDSAFVLVIIHVNSSRVVWTANRGHLVSTANKFVFDSNGSAYLQSDVGVAWSADTDGKKADAMILRNSGNLVLIGDDDDVLWQSFSYPTDTLLTGQDFVAGMKLKSYPNKNNDSIFLEILSGDLVLYIGYQTPQIYWSISKDSRRTNSSRRGRVYSASLVSNSWSFYDENRALLWNFVFSDNSGEGNLWAAIVGPDGLIKFQNLNMGKFLADESTKIPQNSCSVPEPCEPYSVCFFSNLCQCPAPLTARFGSCKQTPSLPSCDGSNSGEFFYVGERLDYFALDFVPPVVKPNLNSCKEACRSNCSCNVLFFNSSSGNCFMFDRIGSYQRSDNGYVSYMKISMTAQKSSKKDALMISLITLSTMVVIAGLVYLGFWYFHKNKSEELDKLDEDSDKFLDSLSGGPIRFRYDDLSQATKNFSSRIGQGGFGSVYLGVLPDGSRLAVKKLEGLGQGKREFRSEVTIIGSLHHVHLVRLKGFCAEGEHRLLVYEYMPNGSLDRWIFKNKDGDGPTLDWDTRYNIALGTAKGLAYLHEECEGKIIHCDIKPENVLLDDAFMAKVSDFGLAKLMSRDESLVYTTMRGTRGYLAPEWITNNPISAKTDVYSYGMVLLEIIGGRKNYRENSGENSNLPVYAFKMLEESRLFDIVDPTMKFDRSDERVIDSIKIALWCIQEDTSLRPPMTKVVQMLEGMYLVPHPPTSTHLMESVKWSSEDGSGSRLIDWSSDAFLSDVRLSGPR